MQYTRGDLAKESGISFETLRFYERKKLLPTPKRNESGYRIYEEEDVKRLSFVKHAKECGFTLEEIKNLFSVLERRKVDLNSVKVTVDNKIEDINKKIAVLVNMKELLKQVADNAGNPECKYIYTQLNKIM